MDITSNTFLSILRKLFFFLFLICNIRGYSQISFDRHVITSSLGTYLTSVDVGDLNNDCLNDIVVTSFNTITFFYEVSFFIQNSLGKLEQPLKLPYQFFYLQAVKIADVNNDFLNDIIIAGADSIVIYHQNQNGQFPSFVSFYADHLATGLDVGDLNNDGLTDIAISHETDTCITIFYQKSGGNFDIKKINHIDVSDFNQLIVNDINSDGLDDILKTDYASILTFYQSCSVSGIDSTEYRSTYRDYNYDIILNGIDVGELGDPEGKNSLAITLGGNNSVVIVVDQNKDGSLNPLPTTIIPGFEIPTQIKIADFDNDGKNEIAVVENAWERIGICERNSDRSFTVTKIINGSANLNPTAIAVGDINNDGLADIVFAGDHELNLHYNTSVNKGIGIKNKSIMRFYPCQKLSNDTIKSTSIQIRTITGIENSCSFIKKYKSKIVTNYILQKGIGDSIITNSSCAKTSDTVKRNMIVSKILSHTIDTVYKDSLISIAYLFLGSTSISGPNSICSSSDEITYSITNTLNANNTWYFMNDSLNSQSIQLVLSLPGAFVLSAKEILKMSEGSCLTFDTLQIQVIPNTLIRNPIAGRDTVCGEETGLLYSIPGNENSIYTWTVGGASFTKKETNIIAINFPDEGKAFIKVTEKDKNACIGPISAKEVAIKKITECISIPNVFTPNEDNVNDIFEIKNINLYPNNKLSVYNRWGSKVYESENYTGTWKAENIPDGIYFYNLEINTKTREKGWLQVIR